MNEIEVIAKGILISVNRKLKKQNKGFVFEGPAEITLSGKVRVKKKRPGRNGYVRPNKEHKA
jgi:hypothetical protein